MAGTLLSDELWGEIEHLFPEYEPSPLGADRRWSVARH